MQDTSVGTSGTFGDIVLIPVTTTGKRKRLYSDDLESPSKLRTSESEFEDDYSRAINASDPEEDSEKNSLSPVYTPTITPEPCRETVWETKWKVKKEESDDDDSDVICLDDRSSCSSRQSSVTSGIDVEVLKQCRGDFSKVLESVPRMSSRLVRNPFYSGSTSRCTSRMSSLSSEFDFADEKTRTDLRKSYVLLRKIPVLKSMRITTRCDVRLPAVPSFKRAQTKECPVRFPSCGPVEMFELFDAKGYMQPISCTEERDDLYFSGRVGSSDVPMVGPITGYSRVYSRESKTILHYTIYTDQRAYTVEKEAFTKKYKQFLEHRVHINSEIYRRKPRPEVKADSKPRLTSSVSSKPLVSKKDGKSKISIKAVLKSLQIQNFDKAGLLKIPEVRGYNDNTVNMIAAFLRFCEGRQKRWELRRMQLEDDGRDPILKNKKFTNLFRELDRGTQYLREQLLPLLKSSLPKSKQLPTVLFKSLLYRLMNKVETFKRFKEIPGPESFQRFTKFIMKEMNNNVSVFTSVHQNMGWERYLSTLQCALTDLEDLSSRIGAVDSLEKGYNILTSLPNVGKFFAWQVLCDLTETRVVSVEDEDDWAALGPGAVKGITLIFGNSRNPVHQTQLLTKIIQKVPISCMEFNLPAPLRINCKMTEHALCEFSKYCRFASEGISNKQFLSRAHLDLDSKCVVCDSQQGEPGLLCILCNRMFHPGCIKGSKSRRDFCCQDCQSID